jgi:ribosomal protein S18 acetylase RimI-like enzyme
MSAEASFQILPCSEREIADEALEALLWRAYVDEGFTAPDVASVAFAAAAVRARGEVLVAWHVDAVPKAAGMVIVVPPTSSGRKIAREDEVEMQLLAVDAAHRGHGLGRRLVERALVEGRRAGGRKMVLWTQPTMHVARHVYTSTGFERAPARDAEIEARTKTAFLVFERLL